MSPLRGEFSVFSLQFSDKPLHALHVLHGWLFWSFLRIHLAAIQVLHRAGTRCGYPVHTRAALQAVSKLVLVLAAGGMTVTALDYKR